MTLRFTPRARDDLREIVDYIAKENPAGADKVRQAISDACALIAARPYLISEFATQEPRNCAAAS
jgi:plasmid stabilization system protein ParE